MHTSSPPDLPPPPEEETPASPATRKLRISHGKLMRQLAQISAAHPGRVGSSHRGEQDPHNCIAVELLAVHGVTIDDLPAGCSIKAAPSHVKRLFTPGAQWLLERVHRWNHRGVTWAMLPSLAEKLFTVQEPR
ncbi:hypothetical protein [Nonomuraea maritima]|uniref:hypothetical protein n=1 Tax=Nonomuraea maritima TaxID=683260 RepID=UPI003720B225